MLSDPSATTEAPSSRGAIERHRPWIPKSNSGIALLVLTSVLLIGLSARLDIPMVPVPMSLQTYAILVIAALAGRRLSAIVILAYLIAAAVGFPVLASGASGLEYMRGNTAGYLMGFLASAFYVGSASDRWADSNRFFDWILIFLIAHGIILSLGTLWLGPRIGLAQAIQNGFLPFLIGAWLKSLAATATIQGVHHLTGSRAPG